MGTNYYAVGPAESPLPTEPLGIHIGKQSSGWRFLFRSHPEMGLTTVEAWRDCIETNGWTIVSEYGDPVDTAEFFEIASRSSGLRSAAEVHARDDQLHVDSDAGGVPFLNAEFC